uniref:Uncharacterized protein n=1 Tax=Prochlorococcus marinus str. P0902-H212 TaxID=1620696 RepID=A0A0D5A304_PROMR|nr:hypothetical protein FA02_0406 [Prochlorococcus marinus str. P0902-H212]
MIKESDLLAMRLACLLLIVRQNVIEIIKLMSSLYQCL